MNFWSIISDETVQLETFLKEYKHNLFFQILCQSCVKNDKIFVKSKFMIGNHEDNEEKVIETINYAKKLKNTLAQFSVFTPYPGTPAFANFENLIDENEMEKFNQYNLVFKHKNFDKGKINKLKSIAYKSFYLRFQTLYLFIFFIKNIFNK